jgi:tetratricopeptide (TPR) repeat protein
MAMKVPEKMLLVLLLIISLPMCAPNQEALWNELNANFKALYQQGRYSEAAKVAKEALKVAEETYGSHHPNVATSLNNLAALYEAQGKYAEAEPLYKRSLEIVEEALGPDYPHVASVLENTAKCYRKMGKEDEAEKLEARAKKIRSNII